MVHCIIKTLSIENTNFFLERIRKQSTEIAFNSDVYFFLIKKRKRADPGCYNAKNRAHASYIREGCEPERKSVTSSGSSWGLSPLRQPTTFLRVLSISSTRLDFSAPVWKWRIRTRWNRIIYQENFRKMTRKYKIQNLIIFLNIKYITKKNFRSRRVAPPFAKVLFQSRTCTLVSIHQDRYRKKKRVGDPGFHNDRLVEVNLNRYDIRIEIRSGYVGSRSIDGAPRRNSRGEIKCIMFGCNM